MPDQPKAPKGMEWYYRPGTTEPELRAKQSAEEPEEEEAEVAEAEEAEEPKKSVKKAASKAARKK